MKTRTRHWIAGAVAAVGLVLGPAYLVYCWYLSGSSVGSYKLNIRHPLTLKLSPEMNPIRFLITATFDLASHSAAGESYDYRAVLAKDGQTIWDERFPVEPPREENARNKKGFQIRFWPQSAGGMSPLRTFSVDQPGEFTLTLRTVPYESAVRPGVNLFLHVRRNVTSPNLAVIIPGFLLALVGAVGWLVTKKPRSGRRRAAPSTRRKRSRMAASSKQSRSRATPALEEKAARAPTAKTPYQIHLRPMPEGDDLNVLLPQRVGQFERTPFDEDDLNEPEDVEIEYSSSEANVGVTLSICETPAEARRGVERAKAETDAEFPGAEQFVSLDTEPSFLKVNTRLGALVAWSRGCYYFSVHAKRGQDDLDRFVGAFPY